MISKLKLGIPLVIFLLFCHFESFGEVFRITISHEVLNDGLRKSLLFSGSQGEIYFIKNIDSISYESDMEISFSKPFESIVHLTVFYENSKERINGIITNSLSKYASIKTYTFLPNDFILLDRLFDREHFTRGRIFGRGGEKETIRLGGVFKLNDVIMQGPFGSVKDNRMKRDSTIKLRFYRWGDEDLSGFIRVNDEPHFRHVFISNQEVLQKKLMINDFEIAHQNAKIILPYKTDWRGNITCENLESGELIALTDFIINGNNVILEDFLFTICDWNQYGRLYDTLHFFTKIFEAPETKIFHNRDFGFNIENIDRGYELEKMGDFDLFQLTAFVNYQEEIDVTNPNIYRNAYIRSYTWKVITATNNRQKTYDFIFPKPPKSLLAFLNYPSTLGSYNNTTYGDIEVVKFELPLPKDIEISNQSHYHAYFKDSAHKIVVKRHEANN